MEKECDVRVQKSNVRCNIDRIEKVTQQFDGEKRLERVIKSKRVYKMKSPRLHLYEKSSMCGITLDV